MDIENRQRVVYLLMRESRVGRDYLDLKTNYWGPSDRATQFFSKERAQLILNTCKDIYGATHKIVRMTISTSIEEI